MRRKEWSHSTLYQFNPEAFHIIDLQQDMMLNSCKLYTANKISAHLGLCNYFILTR